MTSYVDDNAFPKVIFTEGTAPATPASGKQALYIKSADHLPYLINSAGTSTAIGGGTSGALIQISKQVLGSSAATITFSSIAGTYNRLELEVVGRSDASAAFEALTLQVNGDTGANYNSQTISGANSTPSANAIYGGSSISVGYLTAATASAGIPGTTRIIFPGYAGTTFRKQMFSETYLNENDTAGASFVFQLMGEWKNTGAITSILLFPAAGNFITGTTAILWGIS